MRVQSPYTSHLAPTKHKHIAWICCHTSVWTVRKPLTWIWNHNIFFPCPCLIPDSRDSHSDYECTMLTTHRGRNVYSKVVPGYFSDYQAIYINIQASLCMNSSWVLTDPPLPQPLLPCPGGLLTPGWTERDLIGEGWSQAPENTARPRVTVSTLTDRSDARMADGGWSCGG